MIETIKMTEQIMMGFEQTHFAGRAAHRGRVDFQNKLRFVQRGSGGFFYSRPLLSIGTVWKACFLACFCFDKDLGPQGSIGRNVFRTRATLCSPRLFSLSTATPKTRAGGRAAGPRPFDFLVAPVVFFVISSEAVMVFLSGRFCLGVSVRLWSSVGVGYLDVVDRLPLAQTARARVLQAPRVLQVLQERRGENQVEASSPHP